MPEESLNLKKFDINTIMTGSDILTLGSRRSGKSFLVRDIMYNLRHIPTGVCFSSSEEANPFYRDFISDKLIHYEFSSSILESLFLKQRKKLKETGAHIGNHRNNVFLILDDVMDSADIWRKDETIKKIFYNGRCYRITCIVNSQVINILPPSIRQNFDYVFVFDEKCIVKRKKIYESFFGAIPSFETFCNILDKCTKDFGCLVATNNRTKSLENRIFWYKATPRSDFSVGEEVLTIAPVSKTN